MFKSTWFKLEEFQCKCGRCPLKEPDPNLVLRLDALREMARMPIIINSGIRCEAYNARVGGVHGSEHETGEGADLLCATSPVRWRLLNAALKAGFRRLGVGKTFIHVGVSKSHDQDVVWTYYD